MSALYKILCFCLVLFALFADEAEVQIWTEALRKDPENISHLFHLGEAYFKAQRFEDAIQVFKKRIEKKGDVDQIWASKYQLAKSYQAVDQWHEALYWYLEAFQMSPGCSDPLLNIAVYYRQKGENQLAYIFAKHGSQYIPTKYQFEEELSIVSFYTPYREEGYKAASDLLIRKNVPWNVKEQAYQNILYYVQNLKNTHFQPIEIDLPRIVEWEEERYHPMNPSILKTENGYKVLCRAVNYTQKGAKQFDTIEPSGVFKTRNFLIDYTKNFQITSQKEITENLIRDRIPLCNVQGLEDARIFAWQDSLWFTCTNRDNTIGGTPQISLCKLGEDCNVEKMTLLKGPDPYRCEKNWLPFVQNGSFYVIYSYDPFTIYKPDWLTGECDLDLTYEPTHDLSQFRGSAGPIALDDGYLILVHEVVYLSDYSRCYLHRFVYLDHRFYVKSISKPFSFLHQGVEFCNSMTLDHNGEQLILAIGIEDHQAYLCFIDLKTVRSILLPLKPNL